MFLGVIFVLCLLSVPLAGGRLSALGELRMRGGWLVAAAIGTQIVIISLFPSGSAGLHEAAHLGSYGLAGAYAWLNRRVPGLAIAAVGGMANFAAIAANGGVMPASADALRTAGLAVSDGGFQNSTGVDGAHLAWLGDIFAIPASWPVHNVFSIGDVLLVVGVLAGLHIVCASRPARRLGLHAVTVTDVAEFATGTPQHLVRVTTVPHRGMPPGDLLVSTGEHEEVLAPLPGSGHVAGYAVAASVLQAEAGRIDLVMPNTSRQSLDVHPANLGQAGSGPLADVPITGVPS